MVEELRGPLSNPSHDASDALIHEGFFRGVSWGAIFSGAVVAMVVELALGVLGIGIGLGVVNPATDQQPLAGVGVGAGIWFAASTMIALFVGGWVAGRMAGFPRASAGLLHGVVMWGLTTLISFYFMTTAVGMLMSGVAGVIGKGLTLLGQGVQVFAPQAEQQLQQRGITLDTIINQGQQLYANAGQANQQEFTGSLKKLFANPNQPGTEADRENVVNALINNVNMSRPQAEATVNNWINQYYEVQQAKQGALQTAQSAMGAISKAAIWAFIAMLLGAISGAVGGALGSPKQAIPVTR